MPHEGGLVLVAGTGTRIEGITAIYPGDDDRGELQIPDGAPVVLQRVE